MRLKTLSPKWRPLLCCPQWVNWNSVLLLANRAGWEAGQQCPVHPCPINGGAWSELHRACSRFAPSQWETALLCNDVSHWLHASLESTLLQRIVISCKYTFQKMGRQNASSLLYPHTNVLEAQLNTESGTKWKVFLATTEIPKRLNTRHRYTEPL